MEDVLKELRELAIKLDITIIMPKQFPRDRNYRSEPVKHDNDFIIIDGIYLV